MRALSIAATGMLAQQTNVEVIANNLANMNTTGFKEQRAEFQDLLYQNIERPGAATSDTGTLLPSRHPDRRRRAHRRDLSRHRRRAISSSTGNPYDLAINGQGYLPHPACPTAPTPTPAPALSALSPDGQIVTDKGYVGVARHRHSAGRARRSRSTRKARCQATVAGQTAPQTLGQLELTRFRQRRRDCRPSATISSRNARVRFAAGRRSRFARLRHAPAGLSGNLERQRGAGDHRS